MKPTAILRAALVLAIVQYTAHAFLFLSAKAVHGPEEVAVINAMASHHFEVQGFSRSYWDFYFGYGLLAILSGLVEILLLWQIAELPNSDTHQARPIVAILIFANLAHALVGFEYFFLAPIVFDVAIAICLSWAFVVFGANSRATERDRVGSDFSEIAPRDSPD